MMNSAEFYERQAQLAQVYTGATEEHHHQSAQDVTARLGGSGRRILELGAGGGQNAFALAQLGHQVTALDLVPAATKHARMLAEQLPEGQLIVLTDDFYTTALEGPFDAVCYRDGFGIGTDADQRRLLQRITRWLSPGGTALIDIYTPWYWASVAGVRHTQPGWAREYGFDGDGCRMLDTWWSPQQPEQQVQQSLRCYSPADLRLLLDGTGLMLKEVAPQGMFDQAAWVFRPDAPLEQSMTYLAVLSRSG